MHVILSTFGVKLMLSWLSKTKIEKTCSIFIMRAGIESMMNTFILIAIGLLLLEFTLIEMTSRYTECWTTRVQINSQWCMLWCCKMQLKKHGLPIMREEWDSNNKRRKKKRRMKLKVEMMQSKKSSQLKKNHNQLKWMLLVHHWLVVLLLLLKPNQHKQTQFQFNHQSQLRVNALFQI